MTATTTTFRTEPFSCPSCVNKIETVLGCMDGVDSVDVKFNSNRVVVSHDADTASAQAIAERITDLGYPVVSTK